MSFSIEKYASNENPEFEGLEQIQTSSIIGVPHYLDYVEFGAKKDGTKYIRVRAKFDDNRMAWYYSASFGLVNTLIRVNDDLGTVPSNAHVKIGKVDVGGKNPMLVYLDAPISE